MGKTEEKGKGWTILAAALTNTPRARQKDHPISIVEKNGTKFLRVPLIRKCRIKFRDKVIAFGQDEFDQMLRNHTDRVWDAPPYIRVGHHDSPALAWFAKVGDEEPAGKMVQENDWLVAYALPTDDEVEKAKRGYRYSSIDVHPDYSSNQMGLAFSSDEFEEVDEDEVTEEVSMSDDDKKEKVITLSEKEYKSLLASESDKNATLQKELDEVKAMKAKLETERVANHRQLFMASVDGVIEKATARRSEDGKTALPAFVLNTAKSIMKLEAIESGSGAIELDRTGGEIAVVDYIYNAMNYLLTNMSITSMATEGSTGHEENKMDAGEKETIKFGTEEIGLEEFLGAEARLSVGLPAKEETQ